jgi:hypothetical protein
MWKKKAGPTPGPTSRQGSAMTTPAPARDEAAAAEARAEFEAFNLAFERAAAAAGGIAERPFLIAGKRVLIQFAGKALLPYLTPAISHLESPFDANPDLRIRAWDSRSTGVRLPAKAGSLEAHQERGMPGSWERGDVLSAYLRPDPGLSMFHVDAREGVYWLPDAAKTPYEDRSGPFRGILNWFMSRNGRQFVHGAAIGNEAGNGILVVGKSGSGKSTTALTSMLWGVKYAGDDYCLLEPGPVPVVHSLYASAKLHGDHLERFPDLKAKLANPHRIEMEKGVLLLREHYPDRIVTRLRPLAVVVPRITHEPDTAFVPTGRPRALAALAPSSLLQLAATREGSMRLMAELVRQLPAFELQLGTDLRQIPGAVLDLISQLEGANE